MALTLGLDLQMTDAVLRFAHVISGITWIGLLYFFNLINGGFMARLDADTKKEVFPKLMLPTLWWFRWAAMSTLVFGLLLYLLRVKNFPAPDMWGFGAYAGANWGIHLGMLIAITMWFNVWFVIWPAQQQIIGHHLDLNEAPDPAVPRRAFLASRYNTFASVPMLLLMLSSQHWSWMTSAFTAYNFGIFLLVTLVLLLVAWGLIRMPLKFAQLGEGETDTTSTPAVEDEPGDEDRPSFSSTDPVDDEAKEE